MLIGKVAKPHLSEMETLFERIELNRCLALLPY
jgi:hypothetical protein